jgi:Fur family peroxide stress response transcriptional regulator
MKINTLQIKEKLQQAELKVTPQRLAIIEAIYVLNNHPTAANILDYIRDVHPRIAPGTIYKILDVLVENNIIRKVKTEKDIMRYDGIIKHHHHLYCDTCDEIEDYTDEKLDKYLISYFKKKNINGFKISEIRLQIKGRFDKC